MCNLIFALVFFSLECVTHWKIGIVFWNEKLKWKNGNKGGGLAVIVRILIYVGAKF